MAAGITTELPDPTKLNKTSLDLAHARQIAKKGKNLFGQEYDKDAGLLAAKKTIDAYITQKHIETVFNTTIQNIPTSTNDSNVYVAIPVKPTTTESKINCLATCYAVELCLRLNDLAKTQNKS